MKQNLNFLYLNILFLLIFSIGFANADQIAIFAVGGKISSPDGTPAPAGLKVEATNQTTGQSQIDTTDRTGAYQIGFVDTESNRAVAIDDEIFVVVYRNESEIIASGSATATSEHLTGAYLVLDLLLQPILTSITPNRGDPRGETNITITGENFTDGMTLIFGSTEASELVVVSSTELTAKTPPGTVGSAFVMATNPDGQIGYLEGGFIYGTMQLFAISGSAKLDDGTPAQDGMEVIVTNNTSGGESLTTQSSNGGRFQVSWIYEEGDRTPDVGDQILIQVLQDGEPIGNVIYELVLSEISNARAVIDVVFTYIPPTATEITPVSGSTVGGTPITIKGTDFQFGAKIHVGNFLATDINFVSRTELTATTSPGNAGVSDVTVTNPDGQLSTIPNAFEYIPPPIIISIEPNHGSTDGGTQLTILGENFGIGTSLMFGNIPLTNFRVASPTEITAETPIGVAGPVDIMAVNLDMQFHLKPEAFTYIAPPILRSIVPPNGPSAGGTELTLIGENFESGMSIIIGGVPAIDVAINSGTEATGKTPINDFGGMVNVTVFNPDGQSSNLPGGFIYISPPVTNSIVPSAGITGGGTELLIEGNNFQPGITIKFGDRLVTDFTVESQQKIVAVAPANVVGTVDVELQNLDGQKVILPDSFSYIELRLGEIPKASEGQKLQFSATGENGSDVPLIFTWNFGDGTPEQIGEDLSSVEHVYGDDGDYTLTLSVHTDRSDPVSRAIDFYVENLAPVLLDPPSNMTGKTGEQLDFAVQAIDPAGENDQLTISWNFDDETPEETGSEVSHIFMASGTFSVVVTIEDEDGGSATHPISVEILPTLEFISFSADKTSGDQGDTFIFTAEANGYGTLTYLWDFGDGTEPIEVADINSQEYRYLRPGEHLAKLTITDATENSIEKSLAMTVNNLPPTAEPIAFETDEGVAITLVAGETTDEFGDNLTYSWDLDGDNIFETEATEIEYSADRAGIFPIDFAVTDNGELSTQSVATVTVNNIPPTAEAGGPYNGKTGEPVPIDGASATDAGIGELSYSWDLNGDGEFETIGQNVEFLSAEYGTFSIELKVEDESGGVAKSSAEVKIVPAENLPPVATGDEIETDEDNPIEFDPLANDTDANGDLLMVSELTQPENGTVELNQMGRLIYTPTANFSGQEQCTYTALDSGGLTSVGTITITVNPINDPPIAVGDFITLPEDTLKFPIDPLLNDFDVENEPLTIASISPAQNGTVDPVNMTYSPNANFFGNDFFNYTVTDGKDQATAMVSLTVTPVNDLPIVQSMNITTDEDTPIEITLDATDFDGDSLTYFVDLPLKGQLDGDFPTLIYTPNKDYNGPDRFDFRVNDGISDSLTKTVSITINSIYDPPRFLTTATEISGLHKTGTPIELLIAVENPEGIELSYTFEGLPEGNSGVVRSMQNGVMFRWLPTHAYTGIHDVSIWANNESSLTFALEIEPTNRTPAIFSLENVIAEPDETLSFSMNAEDPDPDSELTFSFARIGSAGTKPIVSEVILTPSASGGTSAEAKLTWTPDSLADAGKAITFIATVSDGFLSDQTEFIGGVGDVNTPPTLEVSQTVFNVRESIRIVTGGSSDREQEGEANDSAVRFILVATDSENDPLIYEANGLPTNATLDPATGQFFWEPGLSDGDGPDGFKVWSILVRVVESREDGKPALSDEVTIRVRVNDRNIIPKMDSLEPRTVAEGDLLRVQLQALDVDGDPITFASDTLPLGADIVPIGPGRAKIEWIPQFDVAGGEPINIVVDALDPKGAIIPGQNRQEFLVTVINTNQPPFLIGEVETQNVLEGEMLQFPVVFSDPDLSDDENENITLTLENSHESSRVMDNSDGTGVFQWQTDFDASILAGYNPVIVATDNYGERFEVPFKILVKDQNRAPMFGELNIPATIQEKSVAVVPLSATDSDNPNEPLRFQLKGNIPSGSIKIAGKVMLMQPKLGDAGTYSLVLRVFDSVSARDEFDFTLEVKPLNLSPTIEPILPVYNLIDGDFLSFTLNYSDPNLDTLDLNLTGKPEGANFDPITGNFSWTPQLGGSENFELTFKVAETETDEKFSAEVSTKIVVLGLDGPAIRNLEVSGTHGVVKLTFDLDTKTAPTSDLTIEFNEGGESPSTEIVTLPAQRSGSISYDWDTSAIGLTEIVRYQIRVTANDGTFENSVIVGPVLIDNSPPVIRGNSMARLISTGADAFGNIAAGTGDVVEIDVAVSDNDLVATVDVVFVDGKKLTERLSDTEFQARIVLPDNPIDLLRSAGIMVSESKALAEGIEYPYHIEATDDAGNISRMPENSEFILRLRDDDEPIAEISPEVLTVSQGEEFSLDASGSRDNSGRIGEYAWDADDSDGVSFGDAFGKRVTFVATRSTKVTMKITDLAGNSSLTTAKIEVIDRTPPEPPTFTPFRPAIVSTENVTVTGTTEPEATVDIFITGKLELQFTVKSDSSGKFSQELMGLTDGTYSIGGISTDLAGNGSLQATPVTLIVDTTPSTIEVAFDTASINGSANRLQAVHKLATPRPQIPVKVGDTGGLAFIDLFLLEGHNEVSLEGGKRRSAGGQRSNTQKVVPLRDLIDGVTYTIKVVAIDIAQHRSEMTLDFTIDLTIPDKVAPQIVFTSPGSDNMLTDNKNLNLQVDLSDAESGLNLTAIYMNLKSLTDGSKIPIEPISVSSVDGKFAEALSYPSEALAVGKYMLTAQAKDNHGNISSGRRFFELLGTPPAVSFRSMNRSMNRLSGELFVSEPATTIEGTIELSGLPGGGSVEVYVNDNKVSQVPVDLIEGKFLTNINLVEGKNEVSLVTVNVVGQKSDATPPLNFVLDTQPPQIEALEPANRATVSGLDELRMVLKDSTVISPIVSGLDENSIEISLDGEPLTVEYDATSGEVIAKIVEELEELTTHLIQVRAKDLSGNVAEVKSSFVFETGLPDLTPPVIAGLEPSHGATVNGKTLNSTDFALSGVAYDTESQVTEIQVRLDGNLLLTTETNKFKVEKTSLKLSDGEHLLSIYARDGAGNEKVVDSKFSIDTVSTVPIFDGLETLSKNRLLTLSGVAEPNSTVNIHINGQFAGTQIADGNGKFVRSKLILSEGENQIFATATDLAGNVSESSEVATVLVDLNAPTIGNPQPSPGSQMPSGEVEMSVNLYDNPSGSGIDLNSLRFILDGNLELFEFTYDGRFLSYIPSKNSIELTELSEGIHSFRVMANDRAGNSAIFNSGDFAVDFTPPSIENIMPSDGSVTSNAEVELTANITDSDLKKNAIELESGDLQFSYEVSIKLFHANDLENSIETVSEFDPRAASLRSKPVVALENGDYVMVVSAEDLAGNVNEVAVGFAVDSEMIDSGPPSIVPDFPKPGEEVSTTDFMAIDFQVLDSDSEIQFEDMSVEVNGVVYTNLFAPGTGNRFDRKTGRVRLFARLQLELGALEDPLELGALEDPLELGALEDPLDLTAMEDPLDMTSLEDPLEITALDDPLDLTSLERPMELASGLNSISITVGDSLSNFSSFNMNFDVSLSPPVPPSLAFHNKEPKFPISGVAISPGQLMAGEEFFIEFNTTPELMAVLLDLSEIDSTLPSKNDALPTWSSQQAELWSILSAPEIGLEAFKLLPIDFEILKPRPLSVPANVESFTARLSVTADTAIGSGRKNVQLILVDRDGNVEGQSISVEFLNPSMNRSMRFNRKFATADDRAFAIVVTNRNNKIYTNSPEIPIAGEVIGHDGKKKLEVEILVNDNSMGVSEVGADGKFVLDRVILEPGKNRLSSFTRSASQLQSPTSIPKFAYFDRTSPTVEFIELPSETSSGTLPINIKFSDDSDATPEYLTLVVNDLVQAVDTSRNETSVTIELLNGENLIAISAIDAAGNVSEVVQRKIIFDNSPPESTPTDLRAELNSSGKEMILHWSPDSKAQKYKIYRSETPITELGNLDPIAEEIEELTFTDVNIDLRTTYFYALTSIIASGLESVRPSKNVNATSIPASRGGSAVLTDGTRFTAKRRAISRSATQYVLVSIEIPSEESLPPLAGAIAGTVRKFSAISQDGSEFDNQFARKADFVIPYPSDTEDVDSLELHELIDEEWIKVEEVKIDREKSLLAIKTDHFATYRVAGPVLNPWDANNDSIVDLLDLVTVAGNFGAEGVGVRGDIDQNQKVDIFDLVLVATHFGENYTAPPLRTIPIDSGEAELSLVSSIDGDLVTVSVNAEVSGLHGFQFDLNYSEKLLTAIDIKNGDFLGSESFWIEPSMTAGKIENVASVRISKSSEKIETTEMAQFRFRLKGEFEEAIKSIELQNLLLSDGNANFIPFHLRSAEKLQFVPAIQNSVLRQNFPNPFNPETWIPYELAKSSTVIVRIYDVQGKIVRTLEVGSKPSGSYLHRENAAHWDGRNNSGEKVSSGIYFYSIETEDFSSTRKMILLK